MFLLIDTDVRGVVYRAKRKPLQDAVVGEELALEREPDNEYDANAIRVLLKEAHIGYVPREYSQIFSAFMDHGYTLRAFISEITASHGFVTMKIMFDNGD